MITLLAILASLLLPLGQSNEPARQTGSISGRVTIEGTGEPVNGVEIIVGNGSAVQAAQRLQSQLDALGPPGDPSIDGFRLGAQVGAAQRSARDKERISNAMKTMSRADGTFALPAIPEGTYVVTAERDGYFSPEIDGNRLPIASVNVTVVADKVSAVTLTIAAGAGISGRAFDSAGIPLPGAFLDALRVTYQHGLATPVVAQLRTTNDRGEYRFFGLLPGIYYLALQGSQTVREDGRSQVRTFYPNSGDPGRARPIVLNGGESLSGIDVHAQTARVSKMSGRIVNRISSNYDTAALTLVPRNRTGFIEDSLSRTTVVRVSNDGSFEIENVAAGSYDLFASVLDSSSYGAFAIAGRAAIGRAFGRVAVDVAEANISGIVVDVHGGVEVKGRVVLNGLPITGNIKVSLEVDDSAASIAAFQQVSQAQPAIGADGSFVIPAVPPAKYRLRTTTGSSGQLPIGLGVRLGSPATRETPALQGRTYIKDVQQSGRSVYDAGMEIRDVAPAALEILMATDGGSIEGTVTAADQFIAQRATVVLLPLRPRRQNLDLYRVVQTGAEGKFFIDGIAPGDYKLFAWAGLQSGAFLNPTVMERYELQGLPVTVRSNDRLALNVPLIPLQP